LAPRVGFHEDVHELDFASLYPNIICEHNLSPETVRCQCHDRADVPELGYSVCDSAGVLPDVLQPIIDDRAAIKARLRDGTTADGTPLTPADREALKAVPRLGDKTFEQAAGFLRIRGSSNPLDASAVHPEAYPVVERILADVGRPIEEVLGNAGLLRDLRPEAYTDDRFGVPTVTDILAELEKPGRDPRPEFETANFREGVESLADLEPTMILEGVITNVTNFGAFVDVGVHQDGLVHISQMADRYVADPREVAKPGDVVKVRVLEVDTERQRIGLSMKMQKEAGEAQAAPAPEAKAKKPDGKNRKGADKGGKEPEGALAQAFRRAKDAPDTSD
ncbi:MAG: S1 RNA-binding domain-containing protein, partial [Thiohalorhabdaceae bacterium]